MHIQGSSIIGTFNFLVFNYMLSGKKENVRETGRYRNNYTRNVIDSNPNSTFCSGNGCDMGLWLGHPSAEVHMSLGCELSPRSQWVWCRAKEALLFHTTWPQMQASAFPGCLHKARANCFHAGGKIGCSVISSQRGQSPVSCLLGFSSIILTIGDFHLKCNAIVLWFLEFIYQGFLPGSSM